MSLQPHKYDPESPLSLPTSQQIQSAECRAMSKMKNYTDSPLLGLPLEILITILTILAYPAGYIIDPGQSNDYEQSAFRLKMYEAQKASGICLAITRCNKELYALFMDIFIVRNNFLFTTRKSLEKWECIMRASTGRLSLLVSRFQHLSFVFPRVDRFWSSIFMIIAMDLAQISTNLKSLQLNFTDFPRNEPLAHIFEQKLWLEILSRLLKGNELRRPLKRLEVTGIPAGVAQAYLIKLLQDISPSEKISIEFGDQQYKMVPKDERGQLTYLSVVTELV